MPEVANDLVYYHFRYDPPFYSGLVATLYPCMPEVANGLVYYHFRYDLLPFYSRLVATLYPCMPEVANDLVQLLKGDFRWHVSFYCTFVQSF